MVRNPVKGETLLVVGSEEQGNRQEFTLVLDMEAMLSIEEATGKPLPVVIGQVGQGFFSAIAALGQAAFARHHPEITRAEVLQLVANHREDLAEALGKAIDAAFPDKDEPGNAKAPPAKPKRTGKRSGRSGAK